MENLLELELRNTTTTTKARDTDNDFLLNAIKNKFAARNANEAAAFSPPKFTIPTLKIANKPAAEQSTSSTNISGSPLNDFLLKQLQDKGAKTNGFVLPDLQKQKSTAFDGKVETFFEIPLLKTSNTTPAATSNSTSGLSSLTSAINNLQVKENASPAAPQTTTPTNIPSVPATIDLSAALASNSPQHHGTPPSRVFHSKHKQRQQQQQLSAADLDFKIPFIDCDRLDAASTKVLLAAPANEYCQIDISNIPLKPNSLSRPSAVGYFLCCLVDKHYRAEDLPLPYKSLIMTTTSSSDSSSRPAVKHDIKPFDFNTKSPDDLVLASLEKYQRRHYH